MGGGRPPGFYSRGEKTPEGMYKKNPYGSRTPAMTPEGRLKPTKIKNRPEGFHYGEQEKGGKLSAEGKKQLVDRRKSKYAVDEYTTFGKKNIGKSGESGSLENNNKLGGKKKGEEYEPPGCCRRGGDQEKPGKNPFRVHGGLASSTQPLTGDATEISARRQNRSPKHNRANREKTSKKGYEASKKESGQRGGGSHKQRPRRN